MKRFFFFFLFVCPLASFGQIYDLQWQPLRRQSLSALRAELRDWEIYKVDAASLARTAGNSPEGLSFFWRMGNRNVELSLYPDNILDKDYRLVVATENGLQAYTPGTVRTYGGHTNKGGKVRMTLDTDFIFGFWEEGNQVWFVQPLRDFLPDAPSDHFVVYEAGAVKPVENARCGVTHSMHFKHKTENAFETEKMVGQCYEVQIALASDFSMFQAYGSVSGVQNFTIGVLNNVQTNYDNEFADEVRYVAVSNFVSSCATCDPWTSSLSSNTLLNSFRDWGNSGGFGLTFDVASLWTNRDFTGDVIGLAWLGSICSTFRYNVLQRFSTNANLLRVLQAHELGHNFNSGHDAAGSSTIMAPSVSSSSAWSANTVSVINSFINSLASSGNCLSNCGSSGNLAPQPLVQLPVFHVCPGSIVPIIDGSGGNPTSWFWSIPGAEPSSSSEQNPVVIYQNPGTYPVQLTATNIFGSNTGNADFDVTVDDQGARFLWYETFENGFGEWQVINPDNQVGWQIKNVGGSPYGKKAAWMSHFGYNSSGQIDGLLSPLVNLSNVSNPVLSIDYAYRRRVSSSSEQLRVKVSTDGGITFPHTLFTGQENGSGIFATGPLLNQSFTPAVAGDWCYQDNPGSATCLVLSLTPFIGQPNVRVLIESVNAGNNNLYIDNIRLQVDCIPAIPPTAAIGASPTSGCAPLTVFFQDNSAGVVDSRLWTFPGGDPGTSSDAFPAVTYSQPGIYNVALEAFNGSGASLAVETDLIHVIAAPLANFSFTVNGNSVQFQNTSQGQGLISWSFGNGQTSTLLSPSVTYSAPGVYQVQLTISNACGQSVKEAIVEIISPPTAAFSTNVSAGCVPLTIQFTGQSTGNPVSVQWLFPGGQPSVSTLANPAVTYSLAGQYTATLIAANAAGSDTLSIQIEVGALPIANFQTSYQIGQSQAIFSNSSAFADSIIWNIMGSTLIDSVLNITFPEDGNYHIQLIAVNACGIDTFSQLLSVVTPPTALFSSTPESGCVPALIEFNNQSSNNSLSYFWQFPGGNPDTSSFENPTVEYTEAGIYTAILVVHNTAGADTLMQSFTIGEGPIAQFVWNYQIGDSLVYCSSTCIGADSILWQVSGQSSTDPEPVFSFPQGGIYEILLIAFNPCGADTSVQIVEVITPPVADFGWINAVCAPAFVQFQQSGSTHNTTYQWIMPGAAPSSSELPNPVVFFAEAGNYQITLIAANAAGADTLVQSLVLTASPEAAYTFEINRDTVNFVSQSLNADTYVWEFGDGSSSEESNPVHHYETDGIYTVRLIVRNGCGVDTATFSLEIFTALPIVNFQANQVRGCAPFEVQFTAQTEYADSFLWIMPGAIPDTSYLQNPVVRYDTPGSYSVTLTAYNPNGAASLSKVSYIKIQDDPVSGFTYEIVGSSITLRPQETDSVGNSFFWNFGDGNFSTSYAPTHEYGLNGIYIVTLEVRNDCGTVTDSQELGILVNSVSKDADYTTFRLFPNPTSGLVVLAADNLPADMHAFYLIWRDETGKFIQKTIIEIKQGAIHETHNISHFPAGVYFFEVKHRDLNKSLFSGKLVVVK